MRLVITAGFDGALHAVALAEQLLAGGHTLVGILVVTPFSHDRVRHFIRQRGMGALGGAARRLLGRSGTNPEDELAAYLREKEIIHRNLRGLARRCQVPRTVVGSLNEDRAIDELERWRPDRVLYTGGGILRRRFLATSGGAVLNAHAGPLPEIRGMNGCEWSILTGIRTAVTIHVIDEGIDTGPTIEEIPLPVRPGDTIERLRTRCAVLAVEGLLRAAAAPIPPSEPRVRAANPLSRQCYVLAPALREILEARLARVRVETDAAQ